MWVSKKDSIIVTIFVNILYIYKYMDVLFKYIIISLLVFCLWLKYICQNLLKISIINETNNKAKLINC